jgi:xylulokinase
MAKDRYILAIDLGTSGPKVGLSSTRGEILDYEFEETPIHLMPEGGAEQDPHDWWRAISEATARLLAKGLVPVEAIQAINLTTQWSGTVSVGRDGRPLMNAIIWMDSRGAPYIKKVIRGLINIDGYGIDKLLTWVQLTAGIPAQSGKDPIAHILYIKNCLPEIYEATYKFLEPKDYLNMRLTGKAVSSYDAICLHWLTDNRRLSEVTYDERLLKMSTIDRQKLPDLAPTMSILGDIDPKVAQELGLSENVKVIIGTPDLQSAAVGSGAVRDFEAHLYLGTSSWLCCHVPYKKTDIFHNMCSMPSAIPDRYLLTNEQECAGACLEYLRDVILFPKDELSEDLCPEDFYPKLNVMAAQVPPGSGGLIFLPWLYGERSPVDDHLVRGGFFNQSLDTTRRHMARAVFEGVAYNSRWLLTYVEKFIGRRLETITMIGGGAQSDLWCQIHADVFDRTVRKVKDPILANVRGAAFLASAAMGDISIDEIPDLVEYTNTFYPNPENRQVYDRLFDAFVEFYERNQRIFTRLNTH